FLDINMPRIKGLDFLRTLPAPPKVIVTSAYEEYALEGYELRVVDYLLKPFRFERFLQAVTAVQQSISHKMPGVVLPETAPANAGDRLFIKVDKRHLQLMFTDIQYLESYGNYVKLYTGEHFHLTARTLGSFVAELPPEFVQVHKSFIINRKHIKYVEGAMLEMANKQVVPVGKSYRKTVRDWFK
ncbi:MAG: LytTR family DNA-binding domain-containing protein, partial [Bacteroidota bacterium]